MGYLLLWIENLAVSLLFVAWVTAGVGRWQRRWLRAVVWLPVALVLLLIYLRLAHYTGASEFTGFSWFYYTLGLTVFFLLGVIFLCVVGLKRTPAVERPTVAARWPRAKLFAAWCVVLALHVITFQNLDYAVNQQLEALRSESVATMLSLSPHPVPDSENAALLY